ncbi:MAG: hypothetical protein ACRD2L_25130 [Terriglobia bacterium]
MGMRTGAEIIADALKLLGNETLTDEAEVWLNNAIARLYEDFRWPFQEKSASGTVTAGSTSVALPADFADFWDRNGLRLVDAQGNILHVTPLQADDFDLIHVSGEVGPPRFARIDLAAMTWEPSPTPGTAYTWKLRYKKASTEITNFAAAVEFPNDTILTQAVFVRGLQFEDDDRYTAELGILDGMTKRFRRGFNVSPTKGTSMRFQSQTFRGIASFR